ncbi:MAG TPA: hypothetical protein VFW35_07410 [Sphingomicrobium sp.]|nr:hypothetical protein [Sphingomicrobium sp.]
MRVEIYVALMLLATGFALWRGTKAESRIGATVLIGNLLTFALEHWLGSAFKSVSLMYLALDFGLAAVLCAVAVKYPCWVAILVSAFQVNGALGHLVKLLVPHTIPFSYAFLLRFWAWPMIIAMLAGRSLPKMQAILGGRDWPLRMRPVEP